MPRYGTRQLDIRDQNVAVERVLAATENPRHRYLLQCVFYVEDETVAVGDHLIVGRGIGYQQRLGAELAASGLDADAGAMYLERFQMVMVWPYDDQCRLIGEDLWEFDDAEHALIKLDPADVLTAGQAGELLAPLIRPLPPFDPQLLAPGQLPA
jgi:hypothetical protein